MCSHTLFARHIFFYFYYLTYTEAILRNIFGRREPVSKLVHIFSVYKVRPFLARAVIVLITVSVDQQCIVYIKLLEVGAP